MTVVVISCNYLYWTEQPSQYSDYAVSWSIRGSHPGRDERFFSSAERSDRPWHPAPFPASYSVGTGAISRGQSDRNVKFTFTFILRLCLRDVDRDNFTSPPPESRCRCISNALFYIGPGFKSGFGVRFNLTKDVSVFSQSHQGICRFHRYSFLAVVYCTYFFMAAI